MVCQVLVSPPPVAHTLGLRTPASHKVLQQESQLSKGDRG